MGGWSMCGAEGLKISIVLNIALVDVTGSIYGRFSNIVEPKT